MMNVPLIFYAAARFRRSATSYELARAHCETTERTLVRADGSTAHEGIFDPRRPARFCASRLIKGFARARPGPAAWPGRFTASPRSSRYTGRDRDLAVAARNADCFIARCPESFVPPWDFDVPPGPDRIDDSSAAAIAASGLWNLAAAHRAARTGAGPARTATPR